MESGRGRETESRAYPRPREEESLPERYPGSCSQRQQRGGNSRLHPHHRARSSVLRPPTSVRRPASAASSSSLASALSRQRAVSWPVRFERVGGGKVGAGRGGGSGERAPPPRAESAASREARPRPPGAPGHASLPSAGRWRSSCAVLGRGERASTVGQWRRRGRRWWGG
ncbi:hypothetical protein KM043_012136 [Ampulex compressa]|nr:hypothetical protein KM043_012136 [Ampulex compressa]